MRHLLLFCFQLLGLSSFVYGETDAQPIFHRTVEDQTFYFDSAAFKNWVGYLQAGQVLPICESTGEFYKICPVADLPAYYIKSSVKLEKSTSHEPARIHKIFAQKDYIDIIYDRSKDPPSVFVDNDGSEFRLTIFPVRVELEYLRYERAWSGGPIAIDPAGELAMVMKLSKAPSCGFDITAEPYGILRISLNECSTQPFKVIIDPGHGGSERGTCKDNVCEADLTLKLSHALREELKKLKIDAALTRESDVAVPFEDRVNTAIDQRAALFVSLHFDLWGPSFYLKEPPTGTSCYYFHEFMSEPAHKICGGEKIAGLPLGSITKRSFYVLHSHSFPSVLVEVANFGHEEDTARVLKADFIKKAAVDLAKKISLLAPKR